MKGKTDYREPACLRIVPFSSLQISSVVSLHMTNLHVGLFVCRIPMDARRSSNRLVLVGGIDI